MKSTSSNHTMLSIFMSCKTDHSSIWQCIYSERWQPCLNPLDQWTWPQCHFSSMLMWELLMCCRYTWLHLSFFPCFFYFYNTGGIRYLRKCLMRETDRSRRRLRRCTHPLETMDRPVHNGGTWKQIEKEMHIKASCWVEEHVARTAETGMYGWKGILGGQYLHEKLKWWPLFIKYRFKGQKEQLPSQIY